MKTLAVSSIVSILFVLDLVCLTLPDRVEQLVKPIDIATLQLLAPMNKFIPKQLQNKMMNSSAKSNPCMGFVVEPYSTFVCYELKDLEWARKLIPDGFELIPTKIFEEGHPKYYAIFGSFNVHTSAFWGTRLASYAIIDKIDDLVKKVYAPYIEKYGSDSFVMSLF